MAQAWGGYASGGYSAWRAGVNGWVIWQNDTQAGVRVQALWQSNYSFAVNYGNSARVMCDGQTWGWTGARAINVGGNGGTVTMLEHDFTVKKSDGGRNITLDGAVRLAGGYANGQSGNHVSLWIGGINWKRPNPPKNVNYWRRDDSSTSITWGSNWDNNALRPWKQILIPYRIGWDGADWGAWSDQRGGSGTKVLNWNQTSYTFTGLRKNIETQYSIYARNQAGDSSHVDSVVIFTTPNNPRSVQATKNSPTSVTVSCSLGGTYAKGIQVKRQYNNGTWSQVADVASSSWTDSSAPAGTVTYQVRSWLYTYSNNNSNRLFSDWVTTNSVNTVLIPTLPAALKASRSSDSTTALSWSSTASVERPWDRILLYVQSESAQNAFGGWKQIASLSGTASSYSYPSQSANSRYRFKMTISNTAGTSPELQSSIISTTPSAPVTVTANVNTDKSISVGSNVSKTNSTLRDIEYSTDSGSTWTRLVSATSSDSYKHTNPQVGAIQYHIRTVRYVYDDNSSSALYSNWVVSNMATTAVAPLAPTVTLQSGSYEYGYIADFTWKQNHPDKTALQSSQVEVTDGVAVRTYTLDSSSDDKTSFTTSFFNAGQNKIRVRTKGMFDSYGAWSDYAVLSLTQNADTMNMMPSPRPKTIRYVNPIGNPSISISNGMAIIPKAGSTSAGFSYPDTDADSMVSDGRLCIPVRAGVDTVINANVVASTLSYVVISVDCIDKDGNTTSYSSQSTTVGLVGASVSYEFTNSVNAFANIYLTFTSASSYTSKDSLNVSEIAVMPRLDVSSMHLSGVSWFDGDDIDAKIMQTDVYINDPLKETEFGLDINGNLIAYNSSYFTTRFGTIEDYDSDDYGKLTIDF